MPAAAKWAAAALLGVLALWGGKRLLFAKGEQAPFVTAPAQMADIEQTVLASGVMQPKQLISVGAQASGRIVKMYVAVGDQVTAGQLIAEIDPAPQRNALDNAEALLAQQRAQRESRAAAMKQAELAFKRISADFSAQASSQAEVESAEATFRAAKADVAALDAQIRQAAIAVDTARVTLGYTKVKAPIEGTVVAILAPEGQTVNAVQAAPTIVKLADLETMTVSARISEADVVKVRAGQTVYFTILGDPDHRYYAKLRTVEPAPESIAMDQTAAAPGGNAPANTAVYYNGLFDVANPEHELRPSMTAQVNIVLSEAKGVLAVPVAAIGAGGADGRRKVQVVVSGSRPQERWVRTGLSDGTHVQILEGLRAGEQVVVGQPGASPSGPALTFVGS